MITLEHPEHLKITSKLVIGRLVADNVHAFEFEAHYTEEDRRIVIENGESLLLRAAG